MAEDVVREAFLSQAAICAQLGSPFTGLLCSAFSKLDRKTAVSRLILDWQGDPAADKDNLPLRVCGGLHFLARSGRAPGLASLYPPGPLPEESRLIEEV